MLQWKIFAQFFKNYREKLEPAINIYLEFLTAYQTTIAHSYPQENPDSQRFLYSY